jgi:hypothetical protein
MFIRVWSDGGARLHPSVWLYQRTQVASFKWESPESVTKGQVRRLVEQSIREFGPLLSGFDLANVRFEFVLPCNILHEAVDQWAFSDGREIGTRSEVRCRMKDPAGGGWRNGRMIDHATSRTNDLVRYLRRHRPPCQRSPRVLRPL